MKPLMVFGILIMAFGIVSLSLEGIHYTTRKNVINVGAVQASVKKERTIPLSPVLGVVAVVAGLAVMAFASRK